MTRPARTHRPASLRDVVHRAHLGMALVSVALAGVLLMMVGMAMLRVYMTNNLQLVARSLAYTVEAAVVFGDRQEAAHVLERMIASEGVAQAQIFDARRQLFVQWSQRHAGGPGNLAESVAQSFLPPAEAAIYYNRAVVGAVVLRSDGAGLLRFLYAGSLALAICLTLSAVVGLLLSRSMLRDIVTPLNALADVARAVHRERSMDRRVPPARIAELRELGNDFNALLGELQARHAQLERQNAALEHEAHHDSLTGLPNRAYFEQRLHTAIEAARLDGSKLGVLFLDNDHFKQVNDTYGHAVGDAILVAVAQRVRAQLRETDVVARLGGDEFAVLLAPVQRSDDAVRIADKIIHAMAAPLPVADGVVLHPSVSIGVALFPKHGLTAEQLLGAADAAMYQAKGDARGTQRMAS